MQKMVGVTFNGLITVIVMYFILFYMLTEAKTLEKTFYQWLRLNLFGFSGLIFVPILISLFLLLIQIYRKEFTEKNTEAS